MRTAIVFPGQGAQKPGMGRSLYGQSAAVRETFERIRRAVDLDVARLCFEADEETLRQTENAQLALFAVSTAAWSALCEAVPMLKPLACAGHSVGEYAALACAGVVSLEQGALLVRKRGELMQYAAARQPGAMAAILGLDIEQAQAACREASETGTVVIANDNSPGQIVISGEQAAVEQAVKRAQEKGAKRAVMLNVSGAFHSPLMWSAANGMQEFINEIQPFQPGECPGIVNATAQAVSDPQDWQTLLPQQIASPVRWRESVQTMRRMGAELFIECGVGEVLSGLLKRIDPEARGFAVNDEATLQRAKEELEN